MIISVFQNGLGKDGGERSRGDDGGGGGRHDKQIKRIEGEVVAGD